MTTFKKISSLALATALVLPTHAASLIDLDFEGGNDFGFSFGFSEGNDLAITNDQNSPNGNNGTEGLEIVVTGQQNAPTAFAGGGWGTIDLSADPSIVPGAITLAQLDSLGLKFDMEVLGSGINTMRLEASLANGDFGNRVDIPTPSGGWSTYNVDFSTLDTTQKMNMVTSMNANNVTILNVAFSFSDDGAGNFTIGDGVRVDNFSANTVPEPSSALLGCLGLALAARRRR